MFRALLSCVVLASSLGAQDPPAPPGGFGFLVLPDQVVVWSDAYITRMDIYRPDAVAPVTGWPCVMVGHGGGGHRKKPEVLAACMDLADHGYVCFAYDVRGDGGTAGWNPFFPHPITSERVVIDAAESFGIAQALAPAGIVDPARLAVTGFSQGGAHAIDAAAWSGLPLPPDPSGSTPFVTHYPTILAAAPENSHIDRAGSSMPGGTIVNDELIDDRDATDPLLVLLNAGDYAGALAAVQGSFSSQALPMLQASSVPVFAMYAWQDFKHQLNASADALPTLMPGVPRRLLLTTGGHTTPKNDIERNLLTDIRRRWFDHFLKGVMGNGATTESYAELAVQADPPAYQNVTSQWGHREDDTWPPALSATSLYLRGGGGLSRNAPTAAEVGPLIEHRVTPGYDLLTYVDTKASKNPALLVGNLSQEARVFESPPFPQVAEIYGRTQVELVVDDTTGTTQLSVELAHIDPNGTRNFITFGTGGLRDLGAGRHTLRFDLGDIVHVVPAGNRLRATITNLADHQPPSYQRIRFAPYFTDTDTTVVIEPTAASRICVPLRPFRPTLTPRLFIEPIGMGIKHTLRLDGRPARAGLPYFTFVSAGSEARRASVHPFAVFDLGAQSLIALGSFTGHLDAQGRAAPELRVPPGAAAQALIGKRLTFFGFVRDANATFDRAFGPSQLLVTP